MNTSIEFLRSVKLFSLLSDTELTNLESSLQSERVKAGEHIFKEGDAGDCLYIIQTGQVEIFIHDFSGEKVTLSTLQSTDILGETAVFDPGPRTASAAAIDDVHVLVWQRDHFLAFLESTPHAGIDLLAMLSRRLREADQILMGRLSSNTNVAIESKLSPLQRAATWIADFSGSMPFLFINLAMFIFWIVVNIELIPALEAFDPYPFGFLTMAVSLEAIFLSIVVLLSQNLNSTKERIRNDVEYEVNLRAERQVSELHKRLTKLHSDISHRLARLEDRSRAS
jgi:CRP/FNR family cyclic AMP-dependent transcriptional regulator